MKGRRVLYMILDASGVSNAVAWPAARATYEQAYSMLLMNVAGAVVRGVSMT